MVKLYDSPLLLISERLACFDLSIDQDGRLPLTPFGSLRGEAH